MEGNGKNHLYYRQETASYMLKHRRDFEPFLEDDCTFEEYSTWLFITNLQSISYLMFSVIRLQLINFSILKQFLPCFACTSLYSLPYYATRSVMVKQIMAHGLSTYAYSANFSWYLLIYLSRDPDQETSMYFRSSESSCQSCHLLLPV